MSNYQNMSLEDLQEIYEGALEQYGDLRAEHEGECAAFGDSWIGAQEEIANHARGLKALENSIKSHPDYVEPSAVPVDLSLWKLPEGDQLPF